MRWFLVLAALTVTSCASRDPGRGERTTQLAACTDALELAGAAPPGEQAEVLARGCPAPCPGFAAWLGARAAATKRPGVLIVPDDDRSPPLVALIGGCHAACDAATIVAPVPPPMRWPAVLEACGADALGLPGEQYTLASDEGIVLAETSRWIERAVRAGVADPQLPTRLEHVSVGSTFALPLPAHPGVPASRFRSASRARQFVLVEDELRVGAMPHVQLRSGRLDALAVPGAYPGQRIELDRIGGVLAQHAELLAQLDLDPAPAPLVIADGATPLSRVLEVVTLLGVESAEVAVSGEVMHAHPVVLERRGLNVALPELEVAEAGITLRGFGDDRQTDWAHLESELDNFTAMNAPIRALELHALPGTSVGDLVRILDACVVARVSAVVFVP